MNLFQGEQILTTTEDNIVVLTTHRIRSNNSYGWGQHSTTSIMLEKVSSIQLIYTSYPILFIVAGVLLLVGYIMNSQRVANGEMFIPVILAIICVGSYFFTRKHVCVVASDGGAKLSFVTANMKKDALHSFIDKVEQAKYNKTMPGLNSLI
jgi:hypothetical protein